MKSLFNMKGTERAAALLVILGKNVAADIMKHLDEDSIEKLTKEIVRIEQLDGFEKEELFGEFLLELKKSSKRDSGGINRAREMLKEAFGDEKADSLVARINDSNPEAGFAFLNDAEAPDLIALLSGENPQMIALVLRYINPKKAGQVLKQLPGTVAKEVALKMAKSSNPSGEAAVAVARAIKEKYKVMKEKSGSGDPEQGVDSLISILSHMTSDQERNLMGRLDGEKPELKQKILNKIFVFENILNLSNNEVRILIDEINDDLIIGKSLKGAGDDIRFKVLRNMSQNRASDVLGEMELMGPVRIDEIEDARNYILDIMRSLSDNGVIVIKRDGEIYVE